MLTIKHTSGSSISMNVQSYEEQSETILRLRMHWG